MDDKYKDEDWLDDRILLHLELNPNGLCVPRLAEKVFRLNYYLIGGKRDAALKIRIAWLQSHGLIHSVQGLVHIYDRKYFAVYRIAGTGDDSFTADGGKKHWKVT